MKFLDWLLRRHINTPVQNLQEDTKIFVVQETDGARERQSFWRFWATATVVNKQDRKAWFNTFNRKGPAHIERHSFF